ncbi:hypothetical protein MMA231_00967 [Asticcacaulis sp. MM231]|uniref:phage protease n=1 Tax=Asticcacaulis sp. MM231 TaxID=3157666 RepID=UPI0032D592CC
MTTKGASHVTAAFAAPVALSAGSAMAGELVFAEDGSATQRVRILPMGPFQTRGKGRYLVADLAHAQAIVATSAAWSGSQDIPVDYDHQIIAALELKGKRAEASGWINPASLSAESTGIYAVIEWTAEAADKIKTKKYRYLSPVIDHESNGRVKAILNAALTIYPAIDGLTTLAASASLNLNQENPMDLTALAASLNLPATATLEEIMAAQLAQATALSAAQANLTALSTALGAADATTALSAATALKATAAGEAAITQLVTGLQSTVNALSAKDNVRSVDDYIAAGNITLAQRDDYVALMATDPDRARRLMANSTSVAGGELLGGEKPDNTKITALSAEQKQVATLVGVSHDAYLKTLQDQQEAGQ